MVPHPEDSPAPFISEITPKAWGQIAHLPRETYLALQERLVALANMATAGRHPVPVPARGAEVETSLSFVMGELVALYEVDFQARVMRLLEVARRLSIGPRKAQGEATDTWASVG
jgi:hypothetical protein